MQLLARQVACSRRADPAVAGEFYFPETKSRTGWDAHDAPSYDAALQAQLRDGREHAVVALVPAPGSAWCDGDHAHWNAWKLNYTRALDDDPEATLLSTQTFGQADLDVRVYGVPVNPLIYRDGWGRRESWGRWAQGRQATIELVPRSTPAELVVRAASVAGQPGPQEITISADRRVIGRVTVDTAPWQWADYRVALPAHAGRPLEVALAFRYRWQASPTDPRQVTLPVESIRVE